MKEMKKRLTRKEKERAQISTLHFTTNLLKYDAMQAVVKLYNHLQMFPDMTNAFAANRAYNELDRIKAE